MGRLLGIDFGRKRCGIAVTDVLQISINPLTTLHPDKLIAYLSEYISNEDVEKLIIGWPSHSDGKETYLTDEIKSFLLTFAKLYPLIEIVKVDEAFTSVEAKKVIFQSGAKKQKRRDKELIDRISAVLLIKRFQERL